jgi:hypothetical protein
LDSTRDPTGEAASGTAEEIERHVTAGRPAMIYFSSAPVHIDSVDAEQYRALKEFRKQVEEKGLIETYDSPTDFQQKFGRHLAAIINTDPHFSVSRGDATNSATPLPTVPDRSVPTLSTEGRALLLEAAADPQGTILLLRVLSGPQILTNGKQLIEPSNSRSRAAWEGALKELVSLRLVEDPGHKGEIFQITREGYALAEILKN